jgi:hypothetical protein
MELNTFRKQVDPVILARGKDYYVNGSVKEIEKNKEGDWLSLVEGSNDYTVEISINNLSIESVYCDCPFNYGPVCKHVVATLFAIENLINKTDTVNTQEINNSDEKRSSLDEIFEKVSKQDLQDFITTSLMGHGYGIESSLIAYFSQYVSGNLRDKYLKIIKNIFDNIDDSYHSYNRYSETSSTLSDSIYALLDSVQAFIEKNKFKEAIVISQCLIEEFAENIEYVDDDCYILEEIFDSFQELIAQVDNSTKDKLFYYCLKEYPKNKYQDYGYDANFLFCLQDLISNKKHQEIFLEMLDTQIKQTQLSGSTNKHINYLKTKYNFLENNNYHDKAQLLLLDNLHYLDFRSIAINHAIEARKFKQAKKLCLEGINSATNENIRGVKRDLYDFLLDIAELEKNKEDICKWAEKLFQQSYRDMDYYKKLKSAYPKKQWAKKCESIINQIRGKSSYGGYVEAEVIANIFIIEKYFERLLKLLQINSTRIQFIDKYANYLIKSYPNHMIDLYATGIKKYAEKTGRPIYHEVVRYMKALSKIPKSEFMVDELLVYFKSNYKNRSAMMEILRNSFHL